MTVETPVQQSPGSGPPASEAPKRRFMRGNAPMIVAVLAAIGAVVLAIVLIGGGDDNGGKSGDITGSKGAPFTISYPSSWRPVSKKELAKLPGKPEAVLRRKDGTGFLVIRSDPGRAQSFGKLQSNLSTELRKRVPDFKERSSKVVKIKAGKGLFTTYVRSKTGTVHSVLVVPAGKRTFTLNSVSRGGKDKTAREIGKMLLSFDY
jgi:hypothetical protein